MERLVSPLRRWLRQIVETPATEMLRKLEFIFYFLFIILSITCFVLPLVVGMNMIPLYIAAAFSFLYAVAFYFFRFKIYAHFGFIVHTGIFLMLLSTIFFESGFYKVGTAMMIIGVLFVIIVLVFTTTKVKVIVRNSSVAQQQADQANALNNNPVVADGQINNLNHALANGDVIPPIPAVANGPVNHHNQDLPNGNANANLANGHAIQQREDPEDEVVQLPNGHAIQMREDPEDEVVQQIEVDQVYLNQ